MQSNASWVDKIFDYLYYAGALACILSIVKYVDSIFKKQDENEIIAEQTKMIKQLMEQIDDYKRITEKLKK